MDLNINIDHVATLRQARGETFPSVLEAAKVAVAAGADGLVLHLREDRRHIQDYDVEEVRNNVPTRLDLEMADVKEIINFALKIKPELVTIVPEKRQELTTEGGLDLETNFDSLRNLTKRMHDAGIFVSMFIEPYKKHIDLSKMIGADMVELHTGIYANASTQEKIDEYALQIEMAAIYSSELKLRVAAGHGLNLNNVSRIAKIKEINELSIGHSIISRAIFVGLENAVKEMLQIVKNSQPI